MLSQLFRRPSRAQRMKSGVTSTIHGKVWPNSTEAKSDRLAGKRRREKAYAAFTAITVEIATLTRQRPRLLTILRQKPLLRSAT